MTTSTAATAPSRCLPTITSIATTSQPLEELIVTKNGTRDIDSAQTNKSTVLRGIPTGNSLHLTTAAVVDRHIDDDASPTPQPRSPLSPTTKETHTSAPLLPQQSAVDEPFDYWSKLVEITAKIDQMKQRWPQLPSIDQGHPINPRATSFPHPSSSLPPTLPAHDASFDYKLQLAANDAAIERMQQRWPLPLQPTDTGPLATTDSDTSAFSSSPQQPTSTTSTQTEPPAPMVVMTQPDTYHPQTADASPVSAEQPSASAKDDISDPTLLAAATTLDNFLLQYPRKLNLLANIPCYQPSPEHGPSLCRHALLAQQTAVLGTINVLLSELCEKVTRFIAASSKPTMTAAPSCLLSIPTVFHSPQSRPTMKPAARKSPLLLSSWPSQTFAPRPLHLPVNKPPNYQLSIPATSYLTCAYNKPRQQRTKDHLRPP